MITYFKHTSNAAFKSLSGDEDVESGYNGMINVVGSNAYTGSILDDNSKLLTSSDTFLSNVYLKKINYNYNNITNSVSNYIDEVKIYPRSILTGSLLNETLDKLNENNLKLYSAGIRYNTNYFNKSHKFKSELPVTHALSAIGSDLLPSRQLSPSLVLQPERDNLGTIIDPAINKGALLVSDSTKFKYLNQSSSITGTINDTDKITFGPGLNAANSLDVYNDVYYDKYNNLIFQANINEQEYSIFRYNSKLPTNTMILLDDVRLSKTNTVVRGKGTVSFGRRYRTCVVIDSDTFQLEVYDVRGSNVLGRFSLSDLGLDEILSIAQRFEDDALVIFGKKDGGTYIVTYDIPEMLIEAKPLFYEEYRGDAQPTYIEFCPFDSDVLFLREYRTLLGNVWLEQLQFVSISSPGFPMATFSRNTVPYTGELFIINELDCIIDQCDKVVLNNTTQNFILDMQFSVDNNINTLLVTNTHIQTDNYPIISSISPFSLKQTYEPYRHTNSSIGLIINNIIRTLVTDIINLYTFYNEKFDVTLLGEILSISPTVNNKINVADFSLYGNESINSRTINRIINTINELQLKLARKI